MRRRWWWWRWWSPSSSSSSSSSWPSHLDIIIMLIKSSISVSSNWFLWKHHQYHRYISVKHYQNQDLYFDNIWLAVWNINYMFPLILGIANHPNELIFFRGVALAHQPDIPVATLITSSAKERGCLWVAVCPRPGGSTTGCGAKSLHQRSFSSETQGVSGNGDGILKNHGETCGKKNMGMK